MHGCNAVWVGNPLWRLTRALATMMDYAEQIQIEGFYDDVVPPSAEDEVLLQQMARTFDPANELLMWDAERFKYDLAGADLLRRYLYDPQLNIDGVWGGYTGPGMKTLLPHEVRVKMDVRLVPNMEPERVRQRIRGHLVKIGRDDLEVHFYEGYPAAKTSVSEHVVQSLIRSCRSLGAGRPAGVLQRVDRCVVLGKNETSPFWFGDWIAEFLGGVEPKANGFLCICQSGLLSCTVCCATRQLRHFSNKRLVFFAPIDDDLVLAHNSSLPTRYFRIMART